MPSLRSLEILIAVVEESSISGAARRLHLSQPAVSHQLSGLEREVGVALIDRGPRGASPTMEGRAFLGHARRAVEAATSAVAAARAGSADATIRLAVAESFTIPFVVPVVSRWNREERTALDLTETTSADAVVAAVRRGDHDVAVLPGPVHTPGLRVEVVGREPVVAVAGPGSTGQARSRSLAEIAAGPVVGVDPSNGFGGWMADRLAEAGLAPQLAVRTRSVQNAAALAAAGFGTALVPRSAADESMTIIPLAPPLHRAVLIVTRSTPHGAIGDLVARLRDHVSAVTEAWSRRPSD